MGGREGAYTRTRGRDRRRVGVRVGGGREETLLLEASRIELGGVENISPGEREGGKEGGREGGMEALAALPCLL